jgi:hypothetical protein
MAKPILLMIFLGTHIISQVAVITIKTEKIPTRLFFISLAAIVLWLKLKSAALNKLLRTHKENAKLNF